MPIIVDTLEEALAPIVDGIMLAVPREVAGVPMEATRALIRRGVNARLTNSRMRPWRGGSIDKSCSPSSPMSSLAVSSCAPCAELNVS